jgi:hypothetical protein
MGHKSPDRWPPEIWRSAAPHVQAMIDERWTVVSYCRTCHLSMMVDLPLIAKVSGPKTVLWNRQSKCKRIGCQGTVEFHGKPPNITVAFRLFAEWPKGVTMR